VTTYDGGCFAVSSSLDCTCCLTFDQSWFTIDIESFPLLFHVICGEWLINELVLKELRVLLNENTLKSDEGLLSDLNVEQQSAANRLKSLRHLMKRFYLASTYLSPEDFSTEETDFQYIQTLVKGWKEPEMKIRTKIHVSNVEKLYGLEIDEENEEVERRRASREQLLNNGILWLGVLSVAGTVAGVAAFFDFDNTELGHAGRYITIVITTIFAISVFLYIQCFKKMIDNYQAKKIAEGKELKKRQKMTTLK